MQLGPMGGPQPYVRVRQLDDEDVASAHQAVELMVDFGEGAEQAVGISLSMLHLRGPAANDLRIMGE